MAVAATQNAPSKLISVNSNEGLIPKNENRQYNKTEKSLIDDISMISECNHDASCFPFSVTESKNAEVEKPRPCSGSSILKRSSRPSSGHSVKFVETETIISIPTNIHNSPGAKNLLNPEFKKTTLETITQQEPLRLPNKSQEEIQIQSTFQPLSKPSSQTSSITQLSEDISKNEENMHSANENEEGGGLTASLSESKGTITKQPSGAESRNTGTESVSTNHLVKPLKEFDLETTTKIPVSEEAKQHRGKLDDDETTISSYQSQYSNSKHPKGISFRRKKAIYNAENCPSDGDMCREGIYNSNVKEAEKRHSRHKSLKLKMSEENVLENDVSTIEEMNEIKEIENEISPIDIGSKQIPTHKKKRLCELYKELKRVRDAIAQMYSLAETEKEKRESDTNSTEEENEEDNSSNDLKDNNNAESKKSVEEHTFSKQKSFKNITGSKDRASDDEVDVLHSDRRSGFVDSSEASSNGVDLTASKDLVRNRKENEVNSINVNCNVNQANGIADSNYQTKPCIEQKSPNSPQKAQNVEKSDYETTDSAEPNALHENSLVNKKDTWETLHTKENSTDFIENSVNSKTIELKEDTFDQDYNILPIEPKKINTNTDIVSKISKEAIEREKNALTNPKLTEPKQLNLESKEKDNIPQKILNETTDVKIGTAEESIDVTTNVIEKKEAVSYSNINALENKSETDSDKTLENNVCTDDKTSKPILSQDTGASSELYSKSNNFPKTEFQMAVVTNNPNSSVVNFNILSEKTLTVSTVSKRHVGEKRNEVIEEDINANRKIENIASDATYRHSSIEDDSDPSTEVNLDFVVRENTKGLKEGEELRESFTDSALMMSPSRGEENDYFDSDENLSDNDDTSPGIDEKKDKDATAAANKIIKDILCSISDMQENKQFKKEFKSIAADQEEISCVVFCDPEDTYNVNVTKNINCTNIDPLVVPSVVGEFELLVSTFTQLSTTISTEEGKIKLRIRLPFMKSEMKYFHCPVLRWLSPRRNWITISSVEYLYEDEDGCILPILEAEVQELGIFAIVAATIKESFTFSHNVHEVSSAVDRETVLAGSYCPRFYTTETQADLMVIPIDRSVIDDSKSSEIEDSSLLVASSSLVIVDLLNDPPQPLTLYILCSKPKSRPWTASMTSRIGTAESGYLSGSRIVSRAKSRESIKHFLECWYDSDNYIVRIADGCLGVKSTLIQKNDLTKDDKVQVTLHEKHNKYLIVEMRKEARRPDVNSVVVNLLKTLREHRVVVCVAQRKDNPRYIKVSCDLKSKVTTRMIGRLEKDHTIRRNLIPAREGDVISLNLRGNIKTLPNRKRFFRLYAMNGFVTNWEIQVVDQYNQRSLQKYCGFLQVSICTSNSFDGEPISGYEEHVKWKILAEIPVTLPKDSSLYDYEKVFRTRLSLKYKGPITIEFLRSFARLIGKEWYNLARGLRLDHVRIQSIAQQNKRSSLENLVYDLLLTWLKRSCHSTDKAVMLAYALRRSGRFDLAQEISEMDLSYKRDYYKIINERRLDKAIHLTSRSRTVLQSWRYLGSFLQFSQEKLNEIDNTESNEFQKCERMLKMWRIREEPHQGPQKLTAVLRKAGFFYIADHITVATRWRPKTCV